MGKKSKNKKDANKRLLNEIKSLKKKNSSLKKKLDNLQNKYKTLKEKVIKLKGSKKSKPSKTSKKIKKPEKTEKAVVFKSTPQKAFATNQTKQAADLSSNHNVKEALAKLRAFKSSKEVVAFSTGETRVSITKVIPQLIKNLGEKK